MNLKIVTLALSLFAVSAHAQTATSTKPAPEGETFRFVDIMPEAPYDIAAFISQHLSYPDTAIKSNIKGRVNVQFVIDSTGKVIDIKNVGKPLGYGLDEEAKRVIGLMPPWKPGSQNGRRVNVYYILPISFNLTD